MKPDTYFFSPQEALRVASEQHRSDDVLQYRLQLCYYDGEKIENNLKNLIHLPVDNLVNTLSLGTYRIPEVVDFTGMDISEDVLKNILKNMRTSLKIAREARHELNKVYRQKLRTVKLDFSEPLRIYIAANSRTRVMQYVSRDIADSFIARGYDVFFNLQLGIEDNMCRKKMLEFNPHITININHFENNVLSDDVFNFVWFQDSMTILTNDKDINIRDRDFVFIYQEMHRDKLLEKGVDENKIFKQDVFPVKEGGFYIDDNIDRENKIIFVGSYYENLYNNIQYDNVVFDYDYKKLIASGEPLSEENIEKVLSVYKTDIPNQYNFINKIQQSIIRNEAVSWMCDVSPIDVEVYGYNWDKCENEKVISKFKGKVEKQDLNKLYNSAKYGLAASGRVINTQRLGEIIYAGVIPVVYDSRNITDEEQTWDDEVLYFKTKEDLKYILDNELKPKNFRSKEMLKHFSYDSFIETILKKIEEQK